MLVIRPGAPSDLPAIAAIQSASPQAASWPVEDYLNYTLSVAESDGSVRGFLAFRTVAEGEFEILNLAVATEARRRGIGRALVRSFLKESRGAVYLEVRLSNRPGIELYKSLGFQEVAVRTGYYALPPESAVVMKFHSC